MRSSSIYFKDSVQPVIWTIPSFFQHLVTSRDLLHILANNAILAPLVFENPTATQAVYVQQYI